MFFALIPNTQQLVNLVGVQSNRFLLEFSAVLLLILPGILQCQPFSLCSMEDKQGECIHCVWESIVVDCLGDETKLGMVINP